MLSPGRRGLPGRRPATQRAGAAGTRWARPPGAAAARVGGRTPDALCWGAARGSDQRRATAGAAAARQSCGGPGAFAPRTHRPRWRRNAVEPGPGRTLAWGRGGREAAPGPRGAEPGQQRPPWRFAPADGAAVAPGVPPAWQRLGQAAPQARAREKAQTRPPLARRPRRTTGVSQAAALGPASFPRWGALRGPARVAKDQAMVLSLLV
jgi:hypothetical protein